MATTGFYTGFLGILLVTILVGFSAKRRVHGSSDFSNAGGKLPTKMVAGALVGGFVGGTSIIGTGELAFRHGFAALWFTLGGGIAILLLGFCAERLRKQHVETLPALLGTLHGRAVQLGASIFLSIGMFIQIIAQILAALPLLSAFWSGSIVYLALVPSLLILGYILFGGFMGASHVGTLKTVLLFVLLAGTSLYLGMDITEATYGQWWSEGRFSLVSSTASSSWAQGGAMVIGIFSTQAYLQPIFAGKKTADARNGAFIAGIVIMLIGLVSAWIGMFMHEHHPSIPPREAITQFFWLYTTPWIAGSAMGVILLSVVMTGAALALSIGTILNQDVIQQYTKHFRSERAKLGVSRVLIFLSIMLAYLIVIFQPNSYILEWAFLSMTLRGVTIFLPVIAYLLRYDSIHPVWVAASVWGAPIITILWAWLGMAPTQIDPFYIGGSWSLLALFIGKWQYAKRTLINGAW